MLDVRYGNKKLQRRSKNDLRLKQVSYCRSIQLIVVNRYSWRLMTSWRNWGDFPQSTLRMWKFEVWQGRWLWQGHWTKKMKQECRRLVDRISCSAHAGDCILPLWSLRCQSVAYAISKSFRITKRWRMLDLQDLFSNVRYRFYSNIDRLTSVLVLHERKIAQCVC